MCLFHLCLKTKMYVLSCYNFWNHTFSVVIIRVHFAFPKFCTRNNFFFFSPPVFSGIQLQRIFDYWKKIIFSCQKVKTFKSSFYKLQPSMLTFLNIILKRRSISTEKRYTCLWAHTSPVLRAPESKLQTCSKANRMSAAGPKRWTYAAATLGVTNNQYGDRRITVALHGSETPPLCLLYQPILDSCELDLSASIHICQDIEQVRNDCQLILLPH